MVCCQYRSRIAILTFRFSLLGFPSSVLSQFSVLSPLFGLVSSVFGFLGFHLFLRLSHSLSSAFGLFGVRSSVLSPLFGLLFSALLASVGCSLQCLSVSSVSSICLTGFFPSCCFSYWDVSGNWDVFLAVFLKQCHGNGISSLFNIRLHTDQSYEVILCVFRKCSQLCHARSIHASSLRMDLQMLSDA
jgi:hypothetical protein